MVIGTELCSVASLHREFEMMRDGPAGAGADRRNSPLQMAALCRDAASKTVYSGGETLVLMAGCIRNSVVSMKKDWLLNAASIIY
jgi:hypothetical protein